MAITHNLGFPRIGPRRELKFACESYWRGDCDTHELLQKARAVRDGNNEQQLSSGLDYLPCGDFALYDHVLSTSFLLGNVPQRFRDRENRETPELDQYFRVARGRSRSGTDVFASEMTKWFDTNYHYIVPEFDDQTDFSLNAEGLCADILAAQNLAHASQRQTKPVILGPLTYLWLGKVKSPTLSKLDLLEQLLPIYHQLLTRLREHNVEWVQIDEPILALELPSQWLQCFEPAYHRLQVRGLNILLATYFGDLGNQLTTVARLPVAGIHIDAVRGGVDVPKLLDQLPVHKVLSLGIIDGRNIWKSDLNTLLDWLEPIHEQLQNRLWLAPSCSLLHVPIDLNHEVNLDPELKDWFAFARQKLAELQLVKSALNNGRKSVAASLKANQQATDRRRQSTRVHNPEVQTRVRNVSAHDYQRDLPHAARAARQQQALQLPPLPTTSIGSFPQTQSIRQARRALRDGQVTEKQYSEDIRRHIRHAVREQEALGLDVLVHGEAERNDMVEYFGEQLAGYAFTEFGWVQSYGSRCVKPPIIFGDVHRPQAMTVHWTVYAQSLTDKPVKGMLTGPITMLQWAFVRNDQPRETTAAQIALALRDEVADLERSGIGIIQVDEPAFREGLPLKQSQWPAYLQWAVNAFRLATAGVKAETQTHTHMCYSEFNDIIESIADLDADVITIETSRSDMALLEAFTRFDYPNQIGPGVYDIHSPNTPTQQQMMKLITRAAQAIPIERLWVNPDCGLKTRQWEEVRPALASMVAAAHELRQTLPEHKKESVSME